MTILASAAQVLRCFSSECGELTVTDLVAKLGMPKSNASRLLRTMRDVGLLETVGTSKRYRPGLMLVDLSSVYRQASTLIQRADAIVARVSAAYGHTGYVTVRDGLEVSAVTDCPGTNALRVVSSIGRRLPAFASATGRSLLARLPDAAVRQMHQARLQPPSPHSPQTVDELIARLEPIRRDGFALSTDEATRGVDAVAVAVADAATGEELSLCIVFPAATTDEAQRHEIARALMAGAAEITGDAAARSLRRAA